MMNDETKELLEYVYKVVEMGKYSSEELMKDLHGKDNKIKDIIKDILSEYDSFYGKIKKMKEKLDLKPVGFMAKVSSAVMMKKDILVDNSDSALADMLIKGLSMGSLEMGRKIDQYEKTADKKVVELAQDIHQFQEKRMKDLKKYL